MINDHAIFMIRKYIDTYLFEPKKSWPDRYFLERSYERWTADEIIARLIEQESIFPWNYFYSEIKTPVEVINEYIYELEKILAETQKEKNKEALLIAIVTLYDLLRYMFY